MLAELKELDKFALAIANRVWDNSQESKDLYGVSLTKENIRIRVELLADQIVKDFPGANPVIVGLMDGATPFADLLRDALKQRQYAFNYTTMSVSSYGHKLVSGQLTLGALPKVKLYAKPVIVIDDVCDTGKTLKTIKNLFLTQYPECVKLMVLTNKGQERPDGCDPDYVGFEIFHSPESPELSFIIGMGLDYLGELRNTDSIKTANPQFLPTPEEEIKLERRDFLRKQIELFINVQAQERQQASASKSEQTLTAPSSALSFFGSTETESKDQIIIPTASSFTPSLGSSDGERT